MTPDSEIDIARLVSLQGRILDEAVREAVPTGTLPELADHFDTTIQPLREALDELTRIGWVAVHQQLHEQLSICLATEADGGVVAEPERHPT